MIERFNVMPKSTDQIIDWDEIVRLDSEGWRLVTIIGSVIENLRYGKPMEAICQKSDNMLEAPKPEVDLDSDTSPIQPRVAAAAVTAEIPAEVAGKLLVKPAADRYTKAPPIQAKGATPASVPKAKYRKKTFKYGGMVKGDK